MICTIIQINQKYKVPAIRIFEADRLQCGPQLNGLIDLRHVSP